MVKRWERMDKVEECGQPCLEVNFGGPDSFFNTLLQDVSLLGHNASLPSKVTFLCQLHLFNTLWYWLDICCIVMLYGAILCYCLRVFNRLTASQFLRGWLGHEAGESLVICNGWPHSSWQPFIFATAFVLQLLHQCQGTLASSGGPQSFLQISIQLAYLEFCNFNMFLQKGWDVLLFGLFGPNFLPTSYINFPKLGLKQLQRSFNLLSFPRFDRDISFAMGFYSKTPQIQRRKPCDPCRVFPSLSLSCKGCSLGLPLTPSARRELEAPKPDWTWKWFLNVPLENEISLQSNPFESPGPTTVAVNIGETSWVMRVMFLHSSIR